MVISGSTGQVANWAYQASGLGTYSVGQFETSQTANSSGQQVALYVNCYRIQP